MHFNSYSFSLLAFCLYGACQPGGAETSIDFSLPIDLDQSIAVAIAHDPGLQEVRMELETAEGRIEQAALKPNPIVGAKLENFLGTGRISGFQGLEITLGVNQLIETAGKRAKRTNLARRERELIDWQRELRWAKIEADVRRAFVAVLLAQESIELRREQLELAKEGAEETARLVEAARSHQVEQTRAQLAILQQRFALQRAKGTLASARSQLAALWGIAPAPSFTVTGSVRLEDALPELSALLSLLAQTASLAQYDALTRIRRAALDLENARAKPNFEIFAGGRYLSDTGDDFGFIAGFDIPWPRFDRNQGNIRTARAQLQAVEFERKVTRLQLLSALTAAYGELASAFEESHTLQTELLPAAEQVLTDTQSGHERGVFSQLAVLGSRSDLFEVREAHLDALSRYAHAHAKIEVLTRPTQMNR